MKVDGYAVSVVDVGETCDGHAEILCVCKTNEDAKRYVEDDMRFVAKSLGSSAILDLVKLEVWATDEMKTGSLYGIHNLAKESLVKRGFDLAN